MRSETTTVYLGLGSNVGNRIANIKKAVQRLKNLEATEVIVQSTPIETEAVGGPSQREFFNAVLKLETHLSARRLLLEVRRIEKELQRKRGGRWGPRAIDVDILLYGSEIIRERNLKVPHPLLHRRLFVLEGMNEIAPEVKHPILKKNMRELLREAETTRRHKDFHIVSFVGPIGAGKSTAAKALAKRLGARLFLEPVEEIRSLGKFYRDPARNSLIVQLEFLSARSRQLRNLSQIVDKDETAVLDYSFDMEDVFSRMNLEGKALKTYEEKRRKEARGIPAPDIVIYLKARPETLLQRIRKRARPMERLISLEYLRRLCEIYERYFRKKRTSGLIILNAEKASLHSNSQVLKALSAEVLRRLGARCSSRVKSRRFTED